MTKRKVNPLDYAKEILTAIPKGVLFTTKAGDKVNAMTIGWGTLGTNWSRPVFAAYIRKGRFTAEMLEKNLEFTINIPLGDFDKKIVGICGSNRGSEVDKIALAGLTSVDSDVVKVPGFKELPLTLECKVIYKQLQELALYQDDIKERFYPQDVDGMAVGANRDEHYTVFGEIVNAYVVE